MTIIAAAYAMAFISGHQMSWGTVSLESNISASKHVFVGEISNVSFLPTDKSGDVMLTVAVDQTIKGSHAGAAQFRMPASFDSDQKFERWQRQKTPFLWLVPGDSLTPSWNLSVTWYSIRLSPPESAKERLDDTYRPGTYFCDYTFHIKPSEILSRAKWFANRYPREQERVALDMPVQMAMKSRNSGDAAKMYVPIIPEMEGIGRQMVLHPDKWISQYDFPESYFPAENVRNIRRSSLIDCHWTRDVGVQILSHFQTEPNYALLLKVKAAKESQQDAGRDSLGNVSQDTLNDVLKLWPQGQQR
jgi:hypothetical protein